MLLALRSQGKSLGFRLEQIEVLSYLPHHMHCLWVKQQQMVQTSLQGYRKSSGRVVRNHGIEFCLLS
jgi:hypothetical protein